MFISNSIYHGYIELNKMSLDDFRQQTSLHSSFSHDFPMISHDFPMLKPMFPMIFLCFPMFPMIFLCFPMFSLIFLCFPMVFLISKLPLMAIPSDVASPAKVATDDGGARPCASTREGGAGQRCQTEHLNHYNR